MNIRRVVLIGAALAAVLLSAFLVGGQRNDQAELALKAAIKTETVDGDLRSAIEQYKAIAGLPGAARATVATALLRMGQCHEKLGDADTQEARKAYERVVREYGDQTEVVAVARTKLDGILRAASVAKAEEGDFIIRKIPNPEGKSWVVGGAVSPDGRYIVYRGGETLDNLWITQILTGEQRILTGGDKDSTGWATGPCWSPDSTKLAYTWIDNEGAVGLRLVALDGSTPRVLVQGKAGDWYDVYDWSPDGKDILVRAYTGEPKYHGLNLVSAADGSARLLKAFHGEDDDYPPFECRFSPDGLTIAYSPSTGEGNRKRNVSLLSLDGSRDIPVVQHPADDALVEWLPDGRGILFASDRSGTVDLWTIAIENGQPAGVPVLVRRSIGPITPLRLTRDGAFYYHTPGSLVDVFTARLDPKTGVVTGPLEKEPLSYQGHNQWPAWSPDGRSLAYLCLRPTVVGPFEPGRGREYVVSVYSPETGKVRKFPHEKVFAHAQWGPDGRYLYLQAANVSGRGFYRMDVESGEITPFLGAGEGQPLRYPQISADGKWIVYARPSGRDHQLMCRDIGTGEEKEIAGSPMNLCGMALSRDRSRLAYVVQTDERTKVLKVMPFPDGEPKEIHRLVETGGISEVAWSADGRFIYYSDCIPGEGRDWHLLRIPAEGGIPQDMELGVSDFRNLSVHPDGTRITFSKSTLNVEPAQVWVMENFLPKEKVAK